MLRLLILAFTAGCAWLQTRAQLPELAWAALLPLGLLASLLLWLATPRRWRPVAALGWLALAVWAGFMHAAWRAELRLQLSLDPAWAGRDVVLHGRVLGLPEITPNGVSFVLQVTAVDTPGARVGQQVPPRVRLSWRRFSAAAPQPNLRGGDCVRLRARLHAPHGNRNPGGFDYEAWLLERGIRATGALRGVPEPASGCSGAARAAVDRTRERIRTHLQTALEDRPYAGVVIGLAVGDQDAIPAQQWTLFRQTGTSHLFSVSGLHITLFSSLVYLLTRLLWRRVPRLNLHLPAHRAGIALGLGAAAAYAVLAGFGIPAQRTVYMLAGAALLAWLDQRASPSRILAAALLVVVLVDPWAALAPGFWLSFGAVAALMWAGAGYFERREPLWRSWTRAQWAVTLGLMPLLLALFHEISLISPLANLIAIPAISLLAVPLSLLAAVSPWPGVALLAHAVVWAVMQFLQFLAALPNALWHGAAPGALALGLAVAGAVVLLLPRGFPARWLGVLLFLPLFWPRLPAPGYGEAWLTVLDVGQGNAIVLRTAQHAIVVDGGPRFASGEDAGSRIVAPYLWSVGINRLHGLVLTHDDLDHSGGVAAILDSHRPAWLLTSLAGQPRPTVEPTGQAILARRPDALACQAGQQWHRDGVTLRVLHPPAHQYAMPGYEDNDRSCVLRVETRGGASALLAGDIGRLSEANLLERDMPVAAEVLVVPHHGSRSSSTPAFVSAVAPQLALISVGHRNRYRHPHPAVLAEYRRRGVTVLRTDRHGALHVQLGDGPPRVTTARASDRRYWHAAPDAAPAARR